MVVPRKSWLTSLIIFIIWVIVVVGGGLLQVKWQHTKLADLVKNQVIFGVIVAMVFLTGVITYLKWWPRVGWKGPNNLGDLLLLCPPALFLLSTSLLVLFIRLPSIRVLMIVIINTLMVGIREELMFRGILFHGISSSFGIWRAVWSTAIIFGAVHTFNSFITGDFNASILQAFFAFMFGIYIAALRVRLDTIIPGIIFHWLWDCLAFLIILTNFLWEMALLPLSMILVIHGLWLLRRCS